MSNILVSVASHGIKYTNIAILSQRYDSVNRDPIMSVHPVKGLYSLNCCRLCAPAHRIAQKNGKTFGGLVTPRHGLMVHGCRGQQQRQGYMFDLIPAGQPINLVIRIKGELGARKTRHQYWEEELGLKFGCHLFRLYDALKQIYYRKKVLLNAKNIQKQTIKKMVAPLELSYRIAAISNIKQQKVLVSLFTSI